MEFIFVPRFTTGTISSSNYFYKPLIETNQVMMFKPSEILINFLMMFLSLDDMSTYLNNGSYEFMSRVRVGYLINKQKKVLANNSTNNMIGGDNNTDIDFYNEGLEILYKGGKRNRKPVHVKKRSFTHKRRARKSMQKRRLIKRRKSKQSRKRGKKQTHKM
jgi:hypothetical protein